MTKLRDKLARGKDISIQIGLKTITGADEYVPAFFGNIDEVEDTLTPEEDTTSIRVRDQTKRLKMQSEFNFVWESQARFFCDFSDDLDYNKFVRTVTEKSSWKQSGETMYCETASEDNFALAGFYPEQNVWIMAKIRFHSDITNAKGGLVWRANTNCSACYGLVYEKASNALKLYRRESKSWGTALATSGTLSWSANVWYWLAVAHIEDTIYCYYSTNGITYNLAFSAVTDAGFSSSYKYTAGNVGLYGRPPSAGKYIYFDEILIRNFDVDKSISEVAKRLAGRAGVTNFREELAFESDFDKAVDLWPHTGGTGQWRISSGRLVGNGTSTWGRIRNTTNFSNVIVDFEMTLPANRRAGIIFCADTWKSVDKSNFYLLEVDQAGYVRFHRCRFNVMTTLKVFPLSWMTIPAGLKMPYRLSFQDGFVSLWCNDLLLCSFWSFDYLSGSLGFAVYQRGTEVEFNSIRVVRLNRAVTQWALNVGDEIEKNLKNLLSNQNGRYYFDGTGAMVLGNLIPPAGKVDVFSGKPSPRFDRNIAVQGQKMSDLDWYSVFRVDGSNCTATIRNQTLLDNFGYRFGYVKNDQLRSDEECAAAAQEYINSSVAKLVQKDFESFPDLRLEKYDRILVWDHQNLNYDDFIVEGLSYNYKKDSGLSMSIETAWTENFPVTFGLKSVDSGISYDSWAAEASAIAGSSVTQVFFNGLSTSFEILVRGSSSSDKISVWWGDGTFDYYELKDMSGPDTVVNHTYPNEANWRIVVMGADKLRRIVSVYTDGRSDFGGDISNLTNLVYLNVEGNNYLSGSITNLTNLTYLKVEGNSSLSGSVTGLTNLTNLVLRSPLMSITGSITNLTNLVELALGSGRYGNSVSGSITNLTNLTKLILSGNNTISGSITNLTNLTEASLDGYNTISGSIENLTNLTTLYLGGYNTVSGSISNLTNLQYLYIAGSSTVSGSLANLTKLVCLQNRREAAALTDFGDVALAATQLEIFDVYNILDESTVNAILAGFWANRNIPKVHEGDYYRQILLHRNPSSSPPTGQGLIDKAALQSYASPPGTATWRVETN